jgi:hypothetical protein
MPQLIVGRSVERAVMFRSTLLFVAVAIGGALLAQMRPAASPAEIDRLIKQLGDDAFPKREEASQQLTAIGEPALAALVEAMKNGEPEVRLRSESIVRAITELTPQQRGEIAAKAAEAFAEANYETAARQQMLLARRRRPTIEECLWVGHDWQLAGRWADAVAGYQRALERMEEVLDGDPENDPLPPPPPPGDGFGRIGRNGKVPIGGLTDFQRRELTSNRAGLILLIGRIQREQLADPAAAVVTFRRILASVPEFGAELPALLAKLAGDVQLRREKKEVLHDPFRGLQILNEFDVLEDLAATQAQLGRIDDAILTLARLSNAMLHTRDDGVDESLAQMSRLMQKSAAIGQTPEAAKLIALTPLPAVRKKAPAAPTPPEHDADSPFGATMTNLGKFSLGAMDVRDLAKLADGRWIAAISCGPRVMIATSGDLVHFDAPRALAMNALANNVEPAIIVDDDGVLWLAWFSNRLSLHPRSSGGYQLWLAHSADAGKTWSPPRAIAADTGGWPMGSLCWSRVDEGRQFRLSWRAACAIAASPARITKLDAIDMSKPQQMWPMGPQVVREDGGGRYHLVVSDFTRGVAYAVSEDGKRWSEPQVVVEQEPNRTPFGDPRMFLDGKRIALIYQEYNASYLRSGTLGDGPAAAPPVLADKPITISAGVCGTAWRQIGDEIVGFVGGGESVWILRAKAADVLR